MLTNHPKLQNALVKCHAEDMIRATPEGIHVPSRFRSVVDDFAGELGAVTARFKLVQTADVVAAFDLAAERAGFFFQPASAYYRNGLAKITLEVPARHMLGTNDRDGGVTPRVILVHGLGGRGGLRMWTGGNISVCTNGMIFGKVIDVSYARHTSGLDVGRMVQRAVDGLDGAIRKFETLIERARTIRANPTTVETLIEAAPERRRRTFTHILDRNMRTYGDSLWGAIQAVTELATHHMSERRDGSHVWAADDWSRVQTERLAREHGLVSAGR